jgi:hypothetical protein
LALLAGCSGEASPKSSASDRAAVAPIEYPETGDGLAQLFGDMLDALRDGDRARAVALANSLELSSPATWFVETFGADLGAKLSEAYTPMRGQFEQLLDVLAELIDNKQTEISVEQFSRSNDQAATGYQAQALDAMKRPTTLYSVRLSGADGVFHMWSFVYEGKSFRWVGKMKQAAKEPRGKDGGGDTGAGEDGEDPGELRGRDAKSADKGKGKRRGGRR